MLILRKTRNSKEEYPFRIHPEMKSGTIQHISTVYNGTPFGPDYEKPPGYGDTHHWVKRSIFWELPYWRKLLIRPNLDVMHIEKNRLLPLAISGFVTEEIYDAVTEICTFFRVLCSKTLHLADLVNMKRTIVQTICKLERIFPPGFFCSMEHLEVGYDKKRIRNKARVEGSIVRENLVYELATYCSLYFDPTIETCHNREPRNFAPQHPSASSGDSLLSVFTCPSRRLYAVPPRFPDINFTKLNPSAARPSTAASYFRSPSASLRPALDSTPDEPLASNSSVRLSREFAVFRRTSQLLSRLPCAPATTTCRPHLFR
ncbi:hypothetical protein LXL04_017183 [Taraxacum kok-saghyz]